MKIKCAHCSKEKNGKCTVKKVTINKNKSRNCDLYEHDESKVKYRQVLPSYPAAADTLGKTKQRHGTLVKQKVVQNTGDTQKHPVTGDLTRFKSSATNRGD